MLLFKHHLAQSPQTTEAIFITFATQLKPRYPYAKSYWR